MGLGEHAVYHLPLHRGSTDGWGGSPAKGANRKTWVKRPPCAKGAPAKRVRDCKTACHLAGCFKSMGMQTIPPSHLRCATSLCTREAYGVWWVCSVPPPLYKGGIWGLASMWCTAAPFVGRGIRSLVSLTACHLFLLGGIGRHGCFFKFHLG